MMNRFIIYIFVIVIFVTACKKRETGITEHTLIETNVKYFPEEDWKSISPEEAGFDRSVIEKVDSFILGEGDFHSFILTRYGYLVFEKYYNGYSRERLNNVKSVTKSVISLLTGIAIEKGILKGTDERLIELFPHYFDEYTDPAKADITLRDLLTMSAGLEWNNEGGVVKDTWWLHRSDPNKYALNVSELVAEPGSEFNYNSSLSHMLAEAIYIRSGKSILDFAKENLFEPLDIKNYLWETDETGLHRGHSELWMTPIDMAKLGLLILAKGNWNGRQLISNKWIEESITPKIHTTMEYEYGYQWWSKKFLGNYIYFAAGFGGQLIIVIPEFDIVIVTTSSWLKKKNSLIGIHIITDNLIKD